MGIFRCYLSLKQDPDHYWRSKPQFDCFQWQPSLLQRHLQQLNLDHLVVFYELFKWVRRVKSSLSRKQPTSHFQHIRRRNRCATLSFWNHFYSMVKASPIADMQRRYVLVQWTLFKQHKQLRNILLQVRRQQSLYHSMERLLLWYLANDLSNVSLCI
jgi:hypothetical protein